MGSIWSVLLGVIATSLTLIFGLMEIVNVAHGEFYMVGAYLSLAAATFFGNFWIGMVVASLFIFAASIPLERFVIRRVEGVVENTVILTIGLLFFLQNLVLKIYGPIHKSAPLPIAGDTGFLSIPIYNVLVGIICVIILIIIYYIINRTHYGINVRATMEDKDNAIALGINSSSMHWKTFGLGVTLSAIGGSLAGPIVGYDPFMGLNMMLMSFIIVVIGGLGNITGAIVSSFIVYIPLYILISLIEPEIAYVIIMIAILCIIYFRPHGIFQRR